MFDFVVKHKRLIQVVLFLIFLPFAFFGVDSYFRFMDAGQAVARVGDYSISQEEFSRALRERQDAIRRIAPGGVDPSLFDNPELRYATLESLIQRRVLLERALSRGMTITDKQLQNAIGELPIFRDESGKFSFARYEQFLRAQNMTPAGFEVRLRQDLILQQLSEGYAGSSFVPRVVLERLSKLWGQRREVSHHTISPDRFLGRVKLEPEAAKKYYEANQAEFRIPEQVRVEYAVLSLETLMQQVRIDPAEVRKHYESRRSEFETKETRQASHILIGVDAGAGGGAREKARARAEELYRQLQSRPSDFAELAKRYSQDPGSAAKGGDLGTISRGTMKEAPEFEEALFRLKPGEISPPVESKFGFHIIRLTALHPAQVKPFEEVRAQIEKELVKQLAGRRFAEIADQFNNTVYEQPDSLKPAAELVKTALRTSGWITRERADDPLLGHPRMLAAIFSEEVLRNRRNTEAIEVAPNTLVAARVLEYKPASVQPFEEVRAALEKKLALREAARLAAEEGRGLLERLKRGEEVALSWSAPQQVGRADRKDLPEPVARHAFRVDASKLPAYSGLESPGGAYVLLRITRVIEAEEAPEEQRQAFAEALRQALGQEIFSAYVASLKQQVGVKISKEQLEKKQ
ncbi:MAG TPA: SurA N-terminal domain-containing protein [Burkholderiales bacterium]|nr:SurA N-terminal domain-containing protein [Burkholderiales bacterium]